MSTNYPSLSLEGKARGRRGGRGRKGDSGRGGSSSGNSTSRGNAHERDRELYGPSIITAGGAAPGSFSGSLSIGTRRKRQEHSEFLARELDKQEQLVREQDGSLDILSKNLSTLGAISHSVSIELDEQTMMLDQLDDEVGNAEDALSRVTAHAQEMVKKSGGPKWFCLIVWLVLIILFELVLLVYT